MIKQEIFNIPYYKESLFDDHKQVLDRLKDKALNKEDFYKVITPEYSLDVVKDLIPIANEIIENFDELIVVSIGGAYLNPSALIDAAGPDSGIEVYFINSTEPEPLRKKLASLNPLKTAVLTISKSGGTLETISILGAIINYYEESGIKGKSLGKYFYFISNKNSTIGLISSELNAKLIEHDQEISGRYSGLSAVSILPFLIKGGDGVQYIQGANQELQKFYNEKYHDAVYFALTANSLKQRNLVNITYESRLKKFLDWGAQIISESLGKNGKGFTPISSKGPEDQHSMFQLYLEGPDDKLYTYYSTSEFNKQSPLIWKRDDVIGNLSTMNIAQVHRINEEASFDALKSINRPLRRITLDKIDAKTFGALVAFSMIEIITIGEINGINPFNQDGVELIKSRTTRAAL